MRGGVGDVGSGTVRRSVRSSTVAADDRTSSGGVWLDLGVPTTGRVPYFLCGPPPPIAARATIFPDVIAPACPEVRGVLLWVERGRVGDLDVALRTHDLLRQNQTWGTTIPVISVDELFARRFGLVDVPMDPQIPVHAAYL